MVLVSSRSFDPADPFDEGLELPLKKLFIGVTSRPDAFGGAVRGENPDGGFAVRITGGLAASSSKDSSSCRSPSDGCLNAP